MSSHDPNNSKRLVTAVIFAALFCISVLATVPVASRAQNSSDTSDAAKAARRKAFEEERARLESGDGANDSVPADPAATLFVSPAKVGMLVGDVQAFTVFDIDGKNRTSEAEWSLTNSYVADLGSTAPPAITAKDHGTVTLRARVGGESAESNITVYAGNSLKIGTVRWSAPAIPGYKASKIVSAVPSANGPDIYTLDTNDAGHSIIRVFFSDGRQLWMKKMDSIPSQIIPH